MRCLSDCQLSHNIDEIPIHSSIAFRLTQTVSILNKKNLYIRLVLEEKLQKVIRQGGRGTQCFIFKFMNFCVIDRDVGHEVRCYFSV